MAKEQNEIEGISGVVYEIKKDVKLIPYKLSFCYTLISMILEKSLKDLCKNCENEYVTLYYCHEHSQLII